MLGSRLEKRVREAVSNVIDPETGLSLGDMRLIDKVKEVEPGVVHIEFHLTSPACPLALTIAWQVKKRAEAVEGVKQVRITLKDHMFSDQINKYLNQS